MKKKIYQWIFFRLMGWRITGTIGSDIKQCVMIVVPHTSWHDFYIGLFARGIIGLEMNFVAKKELFRFPFGYYFRWMGGVPLDRTGGQNRVEAIVEIFRNRSIFRLAIAPEGTRKKVSQWKTGFYFISLQAKIPIIPIAFDYGKKEIKIGIPLYPSQSEVTDFKILKQHFKGVQGKIPEYGFEIDD